MGRVDWTDPQSWGLHAFIIEPIRPLARPATRVRRRPKQASRASTRPASGLVPRGTYLHVVEVPAGVVPTAVVTDGDPGDGPHVREGDNEHVRLATLKGVEVRALVQRHLKRGSGVASVDVMVVPTGSPMRRPTLQAEWSQNRRDQNNQENHRGRVNQLLWHVLSSNLERGRTAGALCNVP